MKLRILLALAAATSVGAAALAACNSSSTTPGTSADDAGGADSTSPVTNDDAGGSDSASPVTNDGAPADSGPEAGPLACADGGPPVHLPPGYTQVVTSTVDEYFGLGAQVVLDENDDPLVSYFAVPASVQGNTVPGACSPPTSTVGCDGVYFTRWDPCAGAFTTPVIIDSTVNFYGSNPGTQLMSLAYDPSTKEIGIAYTKDYGVNAAWSDAFTATMLATQKAGQSAFVVQQVSVNNQWGATDVSNAYTPSLAMGGGNLYLTFSEGFLPFNCPSGTCQRFVSSTTIPPDAGVLDGGDAGEGDAGPPPPHYFDTANVPGEGNDGGLAFPWGVVSSIAIDSSGRPAVAFYQPAAGDNVPELVYWRSGMTTLVSVATATVQNDYLTGTLRFEGTAPRFAGTIALSSSATGSITYFSSSDGTTWDTPVNLPLSAGAALYSTLATDGHGNEAIASHYNGSAPLAGQDAGCGGSRPFVTRSSNSGAMWSGCDVNATVAAINNSVGSAYGASRIAGKYVLVGSIEGNGAEQLDGGSGYSIVYYQDP